MFKKGIHVLVLIGLIAITKFTSCKKSDTLKNYKSESTVEKFFNTKTATTEESKTIFSNLKTENERTGFVSDLPVNAGYPIWNKAITTSNGDIIIPLTINNQNLVALLIAHQTGSSYSIKCYTKYQLYNLCHNSNLNTKASEEKLFIFFYMENRAFGTTKFSHIPAGLFADIKKIDADGKKTFTIRDNSSNQNFSGGSSPTPDSYITICLVSIHCVNTEPCTALFCDRCPQCETTVCWTNWVDDGGVGEGDPGGDPGPGGGGGGGGDPCPGSSWYNPTPNPCGGNGDGDPPPVEDSIPVPNPCEQVDSLARRQGIRDLMDTLKLKANDPNDSAEHSYVYLNQANAPNGFISTSIDGNPGSAGIDIDVYVPIDGFLHDHYAGLLSIFSADDVWTICQLYNVNRMVNVRTFTGFVTTAKGTQYMLKVSDTTKFKNFAQKVTSGDFDLYRYTYSEILNIRKNASNASNEVNFLRYLKKTDGGSGLKLFRGNATFTEWTPIGLDVNDNVVVEPCN